MRETIEITADISCRHAPPHIFSKQGDIDARFIRVRFFSCGSDGEELVGQAVRSEIRVKKPDGKLTVNGGEKDGGCFVFPLTEQSLNVSGEAQIDFVLYGENGETLSCVPANLTIIARPVGDEDIVSTNEYTAFCEQVDDLDSSLSAFRSQYASQMAAFASQLSKYQERLGGVTGAVSFKRLSQADYDALGEYDAATVYYAVDENGKVTQYLGAAKLSTGSAPALSSASADGVYGIMVNAEKIEEEI